VYAVSARSTATPEPDLAIALALSAMLALSAVEELRREQPRMRLLQDMAERWQVPLDLKGDDLLIQVDQEPPTTE